jgi:hypothetical protein
MDVHLFCAFGAKKDERPKDFSVHDFDAKRQRVNNKLVRKTYFPHGNTRHTLPFSKIRLTTRQALIG